MFGITTQFRRLNLSVLRKVFSLMGKREKIIAILLIVTATGNLIYLVNRTYVNLTIPAASYGGSYKEGLIGQPRLLNPIVSSTPTDESLIRLVYSGLYKYNNSGQIVPDLAQNLPQISEDQKTYTVILRHDARWHDGKYVTANDVLFTIRTLQNPEFGSPLRGSWLNTVVNKTDDHTIVFSNKDISAPFLHNLTLPIMPEHVWKNVTASNFLLSSHNLEAVGSGPYVLREIKKLPSGKLEHIKFESFSNFYSGKPFISSITTIFYESYEDMVNALHAKLLDGFGFVSLDTQLSINPKKNKVNIYQLPLPQYQAVFFNLKHPIFSDKTIRQALTLATNIPSLLQEVYNDTGQPVPGPILNEQLHTDTSINIPLPNLDTAKALLDNAGWKIQDGSQLRVKGKTPLEFTITTNDLPSNTKTADLLAKQWKKLNIAVHLNIVATKDLADTFLRPRQFDALLFEVKLSPDPDPFVFWHSSQSKDPGLNITQFTNPEVDKLISEARNLTDPNSRLPKYTRIQEIINQEFAAIFINQTVFVYAVSNNVKNIHLKELFDPAYRFFDTTLWYITEKRVLK